MRVTHELAIQIITDIEQCLSSGDGSSIEICAASPEGPAGEEHCAIAFADFTDWDQVRFFGPTWPAALRKAADASRAFAAKNGTRKAVAG
jgi:hypothetical protein